VRLERQPRRDHAKPAALFRSGLFDPCYSGHSVSRSKLVGKIPLVAAAEWDGSRIVVDHLDLHASDFAESVRFYEAVLTPLGIPKLFEREGEACFTHVNVADRMPATQNLHLCFHAQSRDEVEAFHRAGVDGGFRSNGAPGYRDYGPGYYAAYLLDPDGNNIEALYRDVGNPGHAG
jgi:catechol 2,3-dioxygenase-like lactoylglutathione lyase family enzyme